MPRDWASSGRRVGKRLFAYNRISGSAAATDQPRKSSARVTAQHICKKIRIDTPVSEFQQTGHTADISEQFFVFSLRLPDSRDPGPVVRFSNYRLSPGFTRA